MISRLLNWFRGSKDDWDDESLHDFESGVRRSGPVEVHAPLPVPENTVDTAPFEPDDSRESLIRNKYLREDTGTHETLKILDDSLLDSGEEEGFDPYNTGDFDRSRNWERRFKS